MHPMHGVRKELSQRRIMTTSSLSMVVNWDSVISHRSEKNYNPQECGLDSTLRSMLY